VLIFTAREQIAEEIRLADQDARHEVDMLGDAMRPALQDAWRLGGADRLLEVIGEITASERVVRLRWVQADAEPGDPRAPELPRADVRLSIAKRAEIMVEVPEGTMPDTLYAYVPLDLPGEPASALELRRSLADRIDLVARTQEQVLTTMTVIGVCSAILAIVMGWTLVGRRVAKLVSLARAVGRGERPPPASTRARDELGQLAREMNAMAAALAAAADRSEKETSERERLREQLQHADRLATIGTLMSQLAHEIGTPLNVISARTKLIARKQVDGDAVVENASIAADETERIAAVIREFLEFVREGRGPRRAVAVDELVRRVALLLGVDARHRRVELAVQTEPVEVIANAVGLQQVLVNLVVNALHAAPAGSEVDLVVGAARVSPPEGHGEGPGRYARIEVSDRGEGVEPSALAHLFEPFFTTKPAGGGTGLGLAIAARIVEEHRGWIHVSARPGGGTTFEVFVPMGTP
jgi:signal transduction histidine kinase